MVTVRGRATQDIYLPISGLLKKKKLGLKKRNKYTK
jgi:hypothetical protein